MAVGVGFAQDTSAETSSIKKGNFTFSSKYKKSQNDYMKDVLRQRSEVKYEKKFLELSGGLEAKYDNVDAKKSQKNLFVEPELKLGNGFSLGARNMFDPENSKSEHELGLKYKPKTLKNSTFGVSTGTVVRSNSENSQRVRFNTDFYLW